MRTQISSVSMNLTYDVHKSNARIKINRPCIPIICLLILQIQFCSSESNIVTIDVQKAKNLLRNDKYRYIDVRTEEEFMKGHIDLDDVHNIPYMIDTSQGRVKNGKFMEQVMQLCDKEDPLVVGCQSGVRSLYATNILLEAGFKHVYNMGGGYLAWVEIDLPVTITASNVEL